MQRMEALVLTVEADETRVEARLLAGRMECPDCGGVLGPWGWARHRVLRDAKGLVRLRPRRARCAGCGGSHVLLPVFVLVRRVDLADVIGAALIAKAAGSGSRSIAVRLGRPVDTVRGWLRRFERRAEDVRVYFTVLLVDTGPDPIPPAMAATPFAAAVSAVIGAWHAVCSRWPDIGEVSPWQTAVAISQGRLLSPTWP
ncbi:MULTISPECIES: hypothetical protein [Streptomyces]|uniref:hypothetical protein n=1 Tax=Streptomyces TaxID=1883 RepID=UPI001413D5F0|nr:hypothetical protein [Streptomyces sp. VN1]QIP74706.1 hypothetical protein EZV63_36740 [Streptomyces sp. VN1]